MTGCRGHVSMKRAWAKQSRTVAGAFSWSSRSQFSKSANDHGAQSGSSWSVLRIDCKAGRRAASQIGNMDDSGLVASISTPLEVVLAHNRQKRAHGKRG